MTTRLVAADGHLVQVEVGHNDAVEGHRESHQASWQFKAYKGLQHLIVRMMLLMVLLRMLLMVTMVVTMMLTAMDDTLGSQKAI